MVLLYIQGIFFTNMVECRSDLLRFHEKEETHLFQHALYLSKQLWYSAHILTASSSACLKGTGMGAPGFYGHLVVTLDVIFSRGRSKKREQRQFIKVLRFFCVNLFPGSRVWQCCCSRLGHLALRHYKPICLVFMIFAQYFHFVYFFLARNYWVQW